MYFISVCFMLSPSCNSLVYLTFNALAFRVPSLHVNILFEFCLPNHGDRILVTVTGVRSECGDKQIAGVQSESNFG